MKRYENIVDRIRQPESKKVRYATTLYPRFTERPTDYYIVTKQLDRMDLIAYDYYGDETLWWIIQRANNLPLGSLHIKAGTRVRIPYPIDKFALRTLMINSQF